MTVFGQTLFAFVRMPSAWISFTITFRTIYGNYTAKAAATRRHFLLAIPRNLSQFHRSRIMGRHETKKGAMGLTCICFKVSGGAEGGI